jgi:hypothetical protein
LVSLGNKVPDLKAKKDTASGYLETAYKLPQLDVKDVILGNEYEISTPPSSPPLSSIGEQPMDFAVTCEFRRLSPPMKANDAYIESGVIDFLPNRNWAVGKYSYCLNSGLCIEGYVKYQHVQGLKCKSFPKTVHFAMTRKNHSSKTEYDLNSLMVSQGGLNDRMFTIEEFGLGSNRNGRRTAVYAAIISGCLAICIAVILRIRGSRPGGKTD